MKGQNLIIVNIYMLCIADYQTSKTIENIITILFYYFFLFFIFVSKIVIYKDKVLDDTYYILYYI